MGRLHVTKGSSLCQTPTGSEERLLRLHWRKMASLTKERSSSVPAISPRLACRVPCQRQGAFECFRATYEAIEADSYHVVAAKSSETILLAPERASRSSGDMTMQHPPATRFIRAVALTVLLVVLSVVIRIVLDH